MKFEETRNISQPYKLTFEGEEVQVVQAAYIEDICLYVKLGNVGSF